MSEGPLFPKKSDTDAPETESPPVVIERSDDPNFGQITKSTPRGLPSMQGKKMGCSTSVFLLMLVALAMLVGAPRRAKAASLHTKSPAETTKPVRA